MADKNGLGGLKKVLRVGKHYTAERLALNTAVLAVSGVLLFGAAGAAAVAANQGVLGSKAAYTETFVTSKSETDGTVVDVFRSTNGKRAMLVMQFENLETMSQDAKTYQAFVTGSKPSMELTDIVTPGVSGEIMSFGSTGYIGLLLESSEPFKTQILSTTMRANAELTYTDKKVELDEELAGDTSFVEFDQWRMYFNPGASQARKIKSLDARNLDPAAIFYETVLSNEEAVVRGELDAKLMEMRAAQKRIEGEMEKLVTTTAGGEIRLVAPEVPESIADDEVVGEPGTGGATAEAVEEAEALAEGEEVPDATETGERIDRVTGKPLEIPGTGEDSTLELRTNVILPGGYDFDWRKGSISKGYIENVAIDGENVVQTIQRKADEASGNEGLNTDSVRWLLTDGKSLTEDYATARDTALKPLVTIMNALNTSWNAYYDLKSEYQIGLPSQLISLELDLRSAQTSSTIHVGENAVIAY